MKRRWLPILALLAGCAGDPAACIFRGACPKGGSYESCYSDGKAYYLTIDVSGLREKISCAPATDCLMKDPPEATQQATQQAKDWCDAH